MAAIEGKKIAADMHCHTSVSVHAYHTLGEMVGQAGRIGLAAFAVTDHGPAMEDAPRLCHFEGLPTLPDVMEGVRVYKGVEANIIDFDGHLDIPDRVLAALDWVIASFHEAVCTHGSVEQHTRAYLRLAENPYVHVIGHSAGDYAYDFATVLPVWKARGLLVEINKNQAELPRCRELALWCKRLRIPVVADSDAHNIYTLGGVEKAMALLRAVDFPPELIANLDAERMDRFVCGRRQSH